MNALRTFFQSGILEASWAERIGWALLHSLWQIALIAGVYALIGAMLRKRSAQARYLCGCAAMLAMLGAPVATWLIGKNGCRIGQTGRQLYDLASRSEDIEVVAIADIGKPDILHYLLCSEVEEPQRHQLQGNFLVNPNFRARLMQNDRPAEMPWDTRQTWPVRQLLSSAYRR